MDVLEAIRGRRTIRSFDERPVPGEVLNDIFEAATWAPSHRNAQPWEFAVVGPETRAKLLGLLQRKADELLADPDLPPPSRNAILALKDDFGGAPYMVAVLSRTPEEPTDAFEYPAAVACAVQNMLLAAWAHGVGGVWLTVGNAPPAQPVLQVPDGQSVVTLLALGYPKTVPPAPPRETHTTRTRQLP